MSFMPKDLGAYRNSRDLTQEMINFPKSTILKKKTAKILEKDMNQKCNLPYLKFSQSPPKYGGINCVKKVRFNKFDAPQIIGRNCMVPQEGFSSYYQ